MRPIDIFNANSYSLPISSNKGDPDIHHKLDYYASLPPPPPYTSSVYAVDDNKQHFPIDQLLDPYGTNEALVSLQHVKDYLLRIKSLSPMHENISPTDKNTDIKPIPITNFQTSSLNPTSQANTMMTDFSINEGLERIGTTLQNLIDEAQASLLRKPSERPLPPYYTEEENHTNFANYSYHYVQKRYMHSQEKISVAFEQLEQSIQNISFTTISIPPSHYYTKKSSSSSIHTIPTNKIKYMFGTLTTILVILFSRKQRAPYKIMSLLLLFLSFYLKSDKKSSIITTLDKFIIRMLIGQNDNNNTMQKKKKTLKSIINF